VIVLRVRLVVWRVLDTRVVISRVWCRVVVWRVMSWAIVGRFRVKVRGVRDTMVIG
jgi:hypothetical protein